MLKNKTAVITGGGRGIGQAIAREFLAEGAEVLLVSRTQSQLETTREELSSLGRVEILAADVSQEENMAKVVGRVSEMWSGVDILVNAAAIQGPIGPLTDVDPNEWQRVIDVNLGGTFLMIRALAPFMKERKRGKIINFAGGGEGAYPNFSAYVASKGGIVRLIETVAAELRADHIDVNAIAPGAVNTRMLDEVLEAGPAKTGRETYDKSLKQKETGGTPPGKAARLAVFLASEASDGLTGKVISAVWDNYINFPQRLHEIMNSDIYSWRRIKPQDRGCEW